MDALNLPDRIGRVAPFRPRLDPTPAMRFEQDVRRIAKAAYLSIAGLTHDSIPHYEALTPEEQRPYEERARAFLCSFVEIERLPDLTATLRVASVIARECQRLKKEPFVEWRLWPIPYQTRLREAAKHALTQALATIGSGPEDKRIA
jgi:hypothetical protein